MSYEHITCAQSDPVIRYNITQNKLIFKYSHKISQRIQVFNSLWAVPFHCMKNPPVLNDVLLLCKRLDFQVKELGLVPNYRQDYAYKLRVKKLAALAFILRLGGNLRVPLNLFINVELRLLAYFENTWIGQSVGERRLHRSFPHHTWNVRDISGTGSSRTTNDLEAFHHNFNSLLTCQHPIIWKLLESQQTLSRSTIFKIDRGTPPDLHYKREDGTRGTRTCCLLYRYSSNMM